MSADDDKQDDDDNTPADGGAVAEFDEAAPAAPPWVRAGALGLLIGLVLAALGCLGYAWLRRTPDQPFVADRGAVTAMLARTTIVVAVAVILIVGYRALVSRWLTGPRARYLPYTAAAVVVPAVAGLLALRHGSTRAVLERAADAQLGLRSAPVVTVAQGAWLCACLAVLVAAVLSVAQSVSADSAAPPRSGRPLIAAVAVLVVVIAAVAVGRVPSPIDSQTAGRIEAPPTPDLTGAVAYRIDTGGGASLVPAGAGFVTVRGQGYSSDVIEGYDGASGQRRWSFAAPKLGVTGLYSTGTGPDSVVVVQASYYATFPWSSLLLGLDATTGTPLWVKAGLLPPEADHAIAGISAGVLLVDQTVQEARGNWVALSARTGAMLWTKTFRRGCQANAFVGDTAVLIHSCDDKPEVVAEVIDPQTGQQRGVLSRPAPDSDTRFTRVDDARGGRALVSGGTSALVIDIDSGEVVRRIPAGSMAAFLDARALVLVDYRQQVDFAPVAILDVDSGATLATGVVAPRGAASPADLFSRVGTGWATFLPDAAGAKSGPAEGAPALRVIDAAGATRTYPYPCQHKAESIPASAAAPGALLVDCRDTYLGIR